MQYVNVHYVEEQQKVRIYPLLVCLWGNLVIEGKDTEGSFEIFEKHLNYCENKIVVLFIGNYASAYFGRFERKAGYEQRAGRYQDITKFFLKNLAIKLKVRYMCRRQMKLCWSMGKQYFQQKEKSKLHTGKNQ